MKIFYRISIPNSESAPLLNLDLMVIGSIGRLDAVKAHGDRIKLVSKSKILAVSERGRYTDSDIHELASEKIMVKF